MMHDFVPLDGNAAAGQLGMIFSFDVTLARITCASCAFEGALAELRLYGRDRALVLRCRHCDASNIRVLETDGFLNLDMSGTARMSIQKASR